MFQKLCGLLVRLKSVEELFFLKEGSQWDGCVFSEDKGDFYDFLELWLSLEDHIGDNLKNTAVLGLNDFIFLVHNNAHHDKKEQVLIVFGN